MAQSFDIDVSIEADELVVRASGELDLSTRTILVDRVIPSLKDGGAVRIAIVLDEVTFCDSSGLGALLDLRRAAGDAGIDLVLRNVSPPVARLLDLTDVDGWLARE